MKLKRNTKMKINICCRESTVDTAIRLAKDLGDTIKEPISIDAKALNGAFNISWGYQGDEDYFYLNNPKSIKETVDKFSFNNKLFKAGCPVAKCYDYKEIMWLYKKGKINNPLIARKNKMQGGFGMRICLCREQIAGAIRDGYTFFKEYIKPKNEYRVHIFNGKPILIIKKDYIMTYNVSRNDEEETIIERGYPKQLVKIAQQAMSNTSLNFGAVDIIESEDNKLYVLEINTAPALNKKMREPYIKEIIKLLKIFKVI